VATIGEDVQANYIQQAVQKYFACDPTVTDVDFFLLVDEANLGATAGSSGYQSGVVRPDSSPKTAYTQDAPIFGQGRAACTGTQVDWQPAGTSSGGGAGGSSSLSRQFAQMLVANQLEIAQMKMAMTQLFSGATALRFVQVTPNVQVLLNSFARQIGPSEEAVTAKFNLNIAKSLPTMSRKLATSARTGAKKPTRPKLAFTVNVKKAARLTMPKIGKLNAGVYTLAVAVTGKTTGTIGTLVTKPFTVAKNGRVTFGKAKPKKK
jgi:hypothetical protein